MKKEKALESFETGLPFKFTDAELLKKVFIHRSFLNEKEALKRGDRESNERLEFLGDAVLSNAISHILYDKYPELHEGELTRLRARLVNRHTLAKIAREMSLNDYLFLGKGERSSGGCENPTILAGVFEALIAAVYLDLGFRKVFSYIKGIFTPLIDGSLAEHGHFDYKPRLQELTQRVFKEAPGYRLVREEGPPHRKVFEIEVVVGGEVLGTGSAAKKKDAEQLAAAEALEKLKSRHRGPPDRAD